MSESDQRDRLDSDQCPSPSAHAAAAMMELEYLTQVLPDTSALEPSVLVRRAGLAGLCAGEDVARELADAGLVSWTESGIAPTGRPWNGPRCGPKTVFDYRLDDDAELVVPHGWMPGTVQLQASGYQLDEYLMARLGLQVVITALARDGAIDAAGRVRIGALRAWETDPVDTVLNLIVDGLLPDQPHLAGEVEEFRAYRQLDEIQMGMPATLDRA